MTSADQDAAPAPAPRCAWPGLDDPAYARYHDTEWGVPQGDSQLLFEKLVLESFQSGLSWLTILRKRDGFRRAFRGFEPGIIAAFGADDVERLMGDASIVRNRAKIEAAITNARAYLELSERQKFSDFVWSFVDHTPLINTYRNHEDVPAQTETSRALSKALKAVGFCFVGPTTAYAFMQSMGLVNDHLVDCHRHAACRELQLRPIVTT